MHTREFQLLLYCSKIEPDIGVIRAFVDGTTNWQELLALAAQHRVRPLLIRSLKLACWDAVPLERRIELESVSKAIVARNLLFTGELLRLLENFRDNGIPIAAFKGPVLAEAVYGDLSLREFVDLDIFIHEEDTCRAEQVLNSTGYQCHIPGKEYRTAFFAYYGQQPFRGRTGVLVDLHWRLASKNIALPIDSNAAWGRLRELTVAGRTIPTLAPEDLAPFLAAHGTMHGWGSLIWVCDFAELLRKHRDIDWHAIFERAQRARSSRPLLLAILLASTLLDAPAPAELLTKAQVNSTVTALASRAQLEMHRSDPSGDFAEFLNGLATHDLVRHRLWPVATLLVTRTVNDHQAMPLPKPLWAIYHLTRPFRLVGKAAQMLKA
jgi:hypothetical protein